MKFISFHRARRSPPVRRACKLLNIRSRQLRRLATAEANGVAVWSRWAPGTSPGIVGDGALQLNIAAALAAEFRATPQPTPAASNTESGPVPFWRRAWQYIKSIFSGSKQA